MNDDRGKVPDLDTVTQYMKCQPAKLLFVNVCYPLGAGKLFRAIQIKTSFKI